ncbi:MAG: dihydrodipicolinate synthetase [Gemmatimonadetes bacterium]|nr:dihydrodipicolinate synthetase [Gemmatimonadota bacterium]
MIALNGILAPLVTPFQESGDLDLEGFGRNIRAHLAAGCIGVVVTGSTGEAALLDDAERNALIEQARKEVGSDRMLIVGTGSESTRTTIARTRAAAERGADAVLVVAPHYYSDAMSPEALREHYEQVADESPVPVLLYTIPKYMHFSLSPELVAELAQHENIIGMKDSSGDAALFARYLESQSESFRVLTGSGVLFCEAMIMGAHGGILAVSLFAPARSFDVWNAHQQGNHSAALSAQAPLTPLAQRIVGQMGVAGVKAALDRVGLVGGPPRSPLRPLGAPAKALLEELLRAAEPAPVA